MVLSMDSLDEQLVTTEGTRDGIVEVEGRGEKMDEVSWERRHLRFDK